MLCKLEIKISPETDPFLDRFFLSRFTSKHAQLQYSRFFLLLIAFLFVFPSGFNKTTASVFLFLICRIIKNTQCFLSKMFSPSTVFRKKHICSTFFLWATFILKELLKPLKTNYKTKFKNIQSLKPVKNSRRKERIFCIFLFLERWFASINPRV